MAVELTDPGELPRIPDPRRSSFAAVSFDGRIYVIGGHSTTAHFYPSYGFSPAAHVYSAAERRWDQIAPLPIAAQGLRAVAHDGHIFAFGGFVYDRSLHTDPAPKPSRQGAQWAARSTDEVFRYSVREDRWERIARLPRRRSSNVLGVVDGRVFLIGGWDGTPWHAGDSDGRFHDAIDVFDLNCGQCEPVDIRMMPARRAFSATVVGREIVVVGGIQSKPTSGDIGLDRVDAFSPSGGWRSLTSLRQSLFSPGVGSGGDRLVVVGGQHFPKHETLNDIQVLSASGWETVAHLPAPATFVEVLPLPTGKLAILGGHPGNFGDMPHNWLLELSL